MKTIKGYLIIVIVLMGLCPVFIFARAYAPYSDSTETVVNHKLNDQDILRAVKTELLIAPNINPDSLKISVNNGIVTLSGKTDNILTKERAAKIAESVMGVLAVNNNIEVTKALRNDADIKDDIITALANNPATEAFGVNAEVTNGNVVLSGQVQSWQEKVLCRNVAESVRGVRDVTNNIKINYTVFRNDNDIKADILSRLKWDIYVNQQFIKVSVDNGNVSLSGTVASAAEKEWAYDDAWVNGVKSVNDNDLKVQWWEKSTPLSHQENIILRNKEVKAALEQAYILDPKIMSDRVNIKVNKGIVTLRGTVTDLQAKQAAEEDADRTIGVFEVLNDLKVEPRAIPERVELENRVNRALIHNPNVDKFKIEVTADHGKIYLTGNVDNKFEKEAAGKAAASVKGVTAVENDIVYQEPQVEVRTDNEIKKSVEEQLHWDPITNTRNIHVTVENGDVTLTGFVFTRLEKATAEIEAYQGGARYVDNELGVTSGPSFVSE